MSEFTECYFLESNENEEAVKLLKRAAVKGYVYPARDGWVAFVADTSPLFVFSKEIKAANEGRLIYFVNAEDHGWGFEIWANSDFVCGYYLDIDDEMDTEEPFRISRKVDKQGFEQLLQEKDGKYKVLEKYFDEDTEIECIADAYDFTEDMELYFSDWISYHYADLEDGELGTYGEYKNLKLVKVD